MKKLIFLAVAALLAMPCTVMAQSAKEARAITKEHKEISKLSEKELNKKASKAAIKEPNVKIEVQFFFLKSGTDKGVAGEVSNQHEKGEPKFPED